MLTVNNTVPLYRMGANNWTQGIWKQMENTTPAHSFRVQVFGRSKMVVQAPDYRIYKQLSHIVSRMRECYVFSLPQRIVNSR